MTALIKYINMDKADDVTILQIDGYWIWGQQNWLVRWNEVKAKTIERIINNSGIK